MAHPRCAFGASPSRGPSPDGQQSLRTVARLRGPAGMLAGWHRQWPGKAGSTAVAWPRRFIRRGCRFGARGH